MPEMPFVRLKSEALSRRAALRCAAAQSGDVLVFGKMADGTYMVMGRKGTKDDTSRKVRAWKQWWLGERVGGLVVLYV